MLKYVVTAIKKNGQRELAFNRQHLYSFDTPEEAQQRLDDTLKNNDPERVADLIGTKLEVRPVECYPTGDPMTCYFKN